MATLPTPGADADTWGDELNTWLVVSHNADGTLLAGPIDARIAAAAGVSIPDLVSGKIPTSQIPALALTTVQVAASEAAQLALTAQAGDVVVRSDTSTTYMHNGGVAGTMADYTLLDTPADAVTSVNGQIGVIVLGKADVGLGNVPNTDATDRANHTGTQLAATISDFGTAVVLSAGFDLLNDEVNALQTDVTALQAATFSGMTTEPSGMTDTSTNLTLRLQNGWASVTPGTLESVRADISGSTVTLSGSLTSGTTTAGTVITRLPLGYRPSADRSFLVIGSGGATQLDVQADGDVVLQTAGTTTFQINGIAFAASPVDAPNTAVWSVLVVIPTTYVTPFGRGTITITDEAMRKGKQGAFDMAHLLREASNGMADFDIDVLVWDTPVDSEYTTNGKHVDGTKIKPVLAASGIDVDAWDALAVFTDERASDTGNILGTAYSPDRTWWSTIRPEGMQIALHEFAHVLEGWMQSHGFTSFPTCTEAVGNDHSIHCGSDAVDGYGFPTNHNNEWYRQWFSGTVSDGTGVDQAGWDRPRPTEPYKQAVAATSGLIGYWPLDTKSGTVVRDLSSNAQHAAISGDPMLGAESATVDRGSTSMSFDGAGDSVIVPHIAAFDTQPYTLEVLANPDLASQTCWIFSQFNFAGIDIQNGILRPTYWGGTANTSYVIPVGQWTLLQHTYDGTTQRVYANGSEVWNRVPGFAHNTSSDDTGIGAQPNGANPYSGLIAHAARYNVRLDAATCLAHAQAAGLA